MKLALATTTIHVPETLRLIRAIGPGIEFFIAGDRKSPHAEIEKLCSEIGNAHYLHPDAQSVWKCSELIGWNCIQRRNIAFLEALKWGATHIYSYDDDNIPLDRAHFINIDHAFDDFDGPCVSSMQGWLNPGMFLVPQMRQRGFPFNVCYPPFITQITNAKIGVVAGACLGDADVDAVARLHGVPDVRGVDELMRSGFAVDNKTWTIFNSQNTAFVRELAPAMFMLPGVGRYDDILASLICQRVMRDFDYHVHYGKPFTWQQRNEHNLLADLKAEIVGMENIKAFAGWLDALLFFPRDGSVTDCVSHVYASIYVAGDWIPKTLSDAGLAWCDDVEKATTELPL